MPATGERFWEVGLDPTERTVLEAGHGDLDLAPDVLVVGGGILGVATALASQEAGLGSVQLIEAAKLGSGATGGSAGLLQPDPHQGSDPACLVDLARASLERWKQLQSSIPGGLGLSVHDWIGLAPHPAAFVADPPPSLRWLDADDVARLVPDLATPRSGALIPDQARLNPLRAVARLARLVDHVATGVSAGAATTDGRLLTSITTPRGTIRPAVTVFATGLPPQLAGLDLALPADLIKGHLLVTEPAGLRFAGALAPVATRIEDGRLLVGGTLDLEDRSPAVSDDVIEGIHRDLLAALPGAADLAITHRWCCWRPHHPDHLPVIDRVPGLDNAWMTSGHFRTGVLLAPATADLLVEWIRTGRRPEHAAPFTLARFDHLR
ncbi:MAG: FAD-binding oxidoreductase [Acidimicrobiaceae bacterium]|nr:FAD-binding oxidoreductase [Acidimicrobiaceae bacterium]